MKVVFALVTALLLAGQASAAEKCLTGGSLLRDQRDLAAVREAIETACPCASFTGAPDSDGKEYRRCAKTVLKATVEAGALRKPCKKTATKGYSDSTCGRPDEIACGRVTPTSKKRPISCRIKEADRCESRTSYTETACSGQTHCSDVVDWTAGTCVDVRERVPFQAGVRTITFTKNSAVNPDQPRPLDTVIWYPTDPGAGPLDPDTEAVIDAPLAAGGPYPMLMFSHGSCGFPAQSTFLTALLAAQGFIVVAPPHPGNTVNEFPGCGSGSAQVNSFVERPKDIIFVINEMLAANENSLSPFFGAIDPDRIGMSGHSFGGLTTYRVEQNDPRVKVAIPMAAAVAGFGIPSMEVPSLSMLGEIDSVVDNDLIRQVYTQSLAPKYKIEIGKAGHYAFSNFCFPASDCNPPVTLTQDEAHGAVLRWVRPFLERYLNGNEGFAPFFMTPPPGIAFESETE